MALSRSRDDLIREALQCAQVLRAAAGRHSGKVHEGASAFGTPVPEGLAGWVAGWLAGGLVVLSVGSFEPAPLRNSILLPFGCFTTAMVDEPNR